MNKYFIVLITSPDSHVSTCLNATMALHKYFRSSSGSSLPSPNDTDIGVEPTRMANAAVRRSMVEVKSRLKVVNVGLCSVST